MTDMSDRSSARRALDRLIESYNNKDREGLAELYTDDIEQWSALGEPVKGKAAVLEHADHLFATLPDEKMVADVVVTDGESLVVEFTSKGTDKDGKPYQIEFTEVFELEGEKFQAIRTYIDPDVVASIAH